MSRGGPVGGEDAARSARELVFALCHEIGNLLAATRLEAGLLDPQVGPTDLERAAERISEVSARAGSLLALVRPLLAPADVAILTADPLDVLDALRRGFDEHCDVRVAVELKSAAPLPGVPLAPEVIYHLLLIATYCGLEAAAPDGRVRIFAAPVGEGVAFLVEDEGRALEASESPELRGRPLTHAISRSLLALQGGSFEVARPEGRTRLTFAFPKVGG